MTAFVAINFPEAIQSRLEEGRLPRFGPMLMLLARPALAFLAQGVTLLLLSQLKVSKCKQYPSVMVVGVRHVDRFRLPWASFLADQA